MNDTLHAVAAGRVFDGTRLHDNTAVVIDGTHIAGVVPRRELPATIPVRGLPVSLKLRDSRVTGQNRFESNCAFRW